MRQQTLALRPTQPLVIDTPAGLIYIERLESDKRKLRITLPDDIFAFVGEDRALNSSKYVDPQRRPKFNMLSPKTDDAGQLTGVVKMTKFALKIGDK